MFSRRAFRLLSPLLLALPACASSSTSAPPSSPAQAEAPPPDVPFPWEARPSTAAGIETPAAASPPVLIRNATLWLATGKTIPRGSILLQGGKIAQVAEGDITPPEGARVIDAAGKFVTPGIIDTHSHIGVYPMPGTVAHLDGNEASSPVTPDVQTVDGFWPQDPAIERAVAGGVTTLQILPGSANLIGGRAVTLKLRPALSPRQMHFPGAPDGLKMACGENPKRTYGNGRHAAPGTRMGNLAMQRKAFLDAKKHEDDWQRYRTTEANRIREDQKKRSAYEAEVESRKKQQAQCQDDPYFSSCAEWQKGWDKPLDPPKPSDPGAAPPRDPAKETLIGAMRGSVLVHIHCYRADDMLAMLALADEVGFQVRSFHHALEAYKIRDVLAKKNVSISTWADWWGFKMEAYDGIPENIALLQESGALPIVHTDSSEGVQRMNQEASKALASGRRAGMPLTDEEAIRWLTYNPAWALGIEKRVGTLEVGKDADVVLWDRHPFSVYASAEEVWIDGATVHQKDKKRPPWSDFELGQDTGRPTTLLPGGAP
ncbi:amidohydrolase [Polyangium jinanense]|uniref:Amidohydrolase n=1 Tax=Polyangium jinanense TaxID=2829994 RepID=A0A9X4APR5_9BACT|nr:amidohydrolase [Polyangium jinanense]MDC3952669.1 amidohydrolase [Polyangium jinanense]MDC3980288.1 amidohydrolase [Polyangium jinanense]